MQNNKDKTINDMNLLNKKKILFLIFLNLSFWLAKCFIDKFKIKNFKIIFYGQGGDKKEHFDDLKKLCTLCEINIDDCLLLDHDLNYKFFKVLINKRNILSKLKNFLKKNDFIFVTSFNYGLLNALIISFLNIKKHYYVLDDGITSWIKIKNNLFILKTLLYSLTLNKFIFVSKYREINKNTAITSFPLTPYFKNTNKIDISQEYKNFLQKKSQHYKINSNKKYNVLIICAKSIHYKKGIKNFLLLSRKKLINDRLNPYDDKNTFFYFKMHPGYKLNFSLGQYNLIPIHNDHIPLEFYNLRNFNLIITPINTSLIYLIIYSLIEKSKINFYNIYQSDYIKKEKLIKPFQIKEFKLNNYSY